MDLLYHDHSNDVKTWYRREEGEGGMEEDGASLDEEPCLDLEVGRVECLHQ